MTNEKRNLYAIRNSYESFSSYVSIRRVLRDGREKGKNMLQQEFEEGMECRGLVRGSRMELVDGAIDGIDLKMDREMAMSIMEKRHYTCTGVGKDNCENPNGARYVDILRRLYC